MADKYIIGLYQDLEREVTADIARRVKKTGRYTETAELQAKFMREQGYSTSKIQAEVMKMLRADKDYQMFVAENTKEYKAEVQKIIDDTVKEAKAQGDKLVASAGNMSFNNDLDMWSAANIDLKKDGAINQIMLAFRKQTQNELKNLTRTMAFKDTVFGTTGVMNAYQKEVDRALLKVATGTFSFDQAVNDCVHRLAQSGLRSVDYANGRTYQLDTAARMSVRTSLSQMAGRITEHNIEKTGVDLVIVSQHMGSRPEHAPLQNRVFVYEGKSKKYPSFKAPIESGGAGYGFANGIKGINCTHSFYPYWEGISVKEPDIPYDEELYENTQTQRRMERNIRATKREIEAQRAIGGDTSQLNAKLRAQSKEYKEFSESVGLKPKNNRLGVVGGSSNLTKTNSHKKYHSIIEREKADGYRIGSNTVDMDFIRSEEYRCKFDSFSSNSELNECLYETAIKILEHRGGTDYEDMYLINKDRFTVEGVQSRCEVPLEVEYNDSLINAISNNDKFSLIAIHNHPTNILPDGSDYVSSGYRRYAEGIILCHNGKIYTYKVGDRIFTSGVLDKRIDKYTKMPYNMSSEDAHVRVLNEMSKEYGLKWGELK